MVAANPQIIRTGKKITMTPNSREYANLCKSSQIDCMKVDAIRKLSAKFNDALIVHKSELDLVADSKQGKAAHLSMQRIFCLKQVIFSAAMQRAWIPSTMWGTGRYFYWHIGNIYALALREEWTCRGAQPGII